MGAGFKIFTKINRPDSQLVEAFRGLPVANIANEMNRFGCLSARLKTVTPEKRYPAPGSTQH